MAREPSGLRKLAEMRIRFPVGNNRVISVPYDLSTYILCRWQALAPRCHRKCRAVRALEFSRCGPWNNRAWKMFCSFSLFLFFSLSLFLRDPSGDSNGHLKMLISRRMEFSVVRVS